MSIMPENDTVATEVPAIATEPTWCDPRMCDADASMFDDRKHAGHGAEIELSLHDRLTHPEPGQPDYVQTVATFVEQHIADAGPTLGLHSETVGNDRGEGVGFELRMTLAEFKALHAEMGRLIQAAG